MSIQKILVPVDYSDCSKNALYSAIKLCNAFHAKLTLLHAFQVPAIPGEPGGAAIIQDISGEAEQDATQGMKQIIQDFPSLAHIEFNSTIIHAYPTEAIQTLIEKEEYDLVVMGTEGSAGLLEEKLIGSNTYSVIRNANIPVLAIPSSTQIEDLMDIAFAGDYQKIEDKAIFDVLMELCNFFNSTLHILHVNEMDSKITADEAFEAKKFKLYFKHVKHNYHFITNDDIEEGIYDYLDSHKISLLVMIPRKHKLFDRIFKESLTKKIACHAKVPFMTLS